MRLGRLGGHALALPWLCVSLQGVHQDAHRVILQSGKGITPSRGLRGFCRAEYQEAPTEEAALPTLNSAMAQHSLGAQ